MPISKNAQAIIWLGLLALWTAISVNHHPTLLIDFIVTVTLLAAYATAVYTNYIFLIPHFLVTRGYFQYISALLISILILTFAAIKAIRLVYHIGGYSDLLGEFWQNYLIDLFGMVLHLLAAMLLVWIISKNKNQNNIRPGN